MGIVFIAIHANYWPESRAGTQAGHVSNSPRQPGQTSRSHIWSELVNTPRLSGIYFALGPVAKVAITLPSRRSPDTGPNSRESSLSSRLSPSTKYCPSNSRIGGRFRRSLLPGVNVIQCPSSFWTVDPIGCPVGTHAKSAGSKSLTGMARPLTITRFSRISMVSPGSPMIRLKNPNLNRELLGTCSRTKSPRFGKAVRNSVTLE